MIKKFLALSFIFVFTLLLGCSDDNKVTVPENDSIQQELQALIDAKTGKDKLVGVSVSIRQGTKEKWKLVGGESNAGVTLSQNMKFGIASITKTMVAAAILKLKEEGKLNLEDPLSQYLDIEIENIDPSITVFQLLNHFTGLKGYFQHPDIWPRVEGNLELAIPANELLSYIGEPVSKPGDRFEYSNSNYLVLGLIIQEVSGMSVGEYLRSRFWKPLALNNTFFGTNEQIPSPVADAWRDTDGDGILENISDQFGPAYHSVFFTAADAFTSASDLSMWAQHLYNGEALHPDSLSEMLDIITINSGSPYWTGYGLGVRRFFISGRVLYGHTGGMRGYGSYMLYDPISKISIALLNNQSRSKDGPVLRFELVEDMLRIVFDELGN